MGPMISQHRPGPFGALIQTGPHFSGFHGASWALLVAAALAAALWVLVFTIRYSATFPRLPKPGPSTNDLGPEPPAVVNLLVNRWEPTRLAMAATLVDLAAQKVIDLEEVGPDRFIVRHRRLAPARELNAYEHLVLDLVRSRAQGDWAPLEMIQLPDEADAAQFWKRFRKALEHDARSRGLARSRWSRLDWALLAGLSLLALELVAFAFGVAHLGEGVNQSSESGGRWDWFGIAVLPWLGVIAAVSRLTALRGTPSGIDACARWLGVRRHLGEGSELAEQPPAGVAIWGPYLSQAIALGIGKSAAAAIPLGAEDPEVAWSHATGLWRTVRVRYPRRFGESERPGAVAFTGLVGSLFWGGLAFVAVPVVVKAAWQPVRDLLDRTDLGVSRALIAVFVLVPAAMAVYLLVRFTNSAIRMARGVADLGRHRTITGEVVKVHDGRFAVDDGSSDRLVAMRPLTIALPARGQRVQVTFTPHLNHVRAITVLDAGGATLPPRAPASTPD